jgi:hypothetical protein
VSLLAAETTGLKEALASMDKAQRLDVNRELRAEFNALATEVIATARARTSSRLESRAADTLRPGSTSTGAAVMFGRGFAGSFGAEFGAHRGKRRVSSGRATYVEGWNQFRPWRGGGPTAGYFLWPAIRDETGAGTAKMADRLAEILSRD